MLQNKWTVTLRSLARPHCRSISSASTYCRDFVQKHDYEAYLLAPFYPKDTQDAYWALWALFGELASIRDAVSNPVIGQMRIQFWRDAVKGIFEKNPPQHLIAIALHESIASNHDSARSQRYYLKKIIDARETEIINPTFMNMDSLVSHTESSTSAMFYLLLNLIFPSSSPLTDTFNHALSHLGTASALANLLRSLSYHANHNRMVIPSEITAKYGVVQEHVFRRAQQESKIISSRDEIQMKALSDAVYDMACVANDHLITARTMIMSPDFGGKIPARVLPVFLPGIATQLTLTRLEKANFDPFNSRVFPPITTSGRPDLALTWNILKGRWRGRL